MYLLSKAGVTDVDVLCAAVLHGTIEDNDTDQMDSVMECGYGPEMF